MSIENIPVQYLSGVGEKRAKVLSKNLGINSVRDLLYYFPYEWSRIKKISELISGGKQTISGTVESTSCGGISHNMVFFQAIVCDDTGKTKAVWFKRYSRNYDVLSSLKKNILPGTSLILTGAVRSRELWLSEMNVQDFEILSAGKNAVSCGEIIQFYPLTEGFKNGFFRKLLRQILSEYLDRVNETIPDNYMEKYGLVSLRSALKNIHFPGSLEEKDTAIRRLAFEEYFATELRLEWIRHHRKRQKKEFRYNLTKKLLARFKENLPFEFTIAQKRVINEIFSDLLSELPIQDSQAMSEAGKPWWLFFSSACIESGIRRHCLP